jgi:hypothetical protein
MEISFRAGVRTGEERDVHDHPLLVSRGQQSVLLGASHDEPGDDMENTKARERPGSRKRRLPLRIDHARLRVVGGVDSC